MIPENLIDKILLYREPHPLAKMLKTFTIRYNRNIFNYDTNDIDGEKDKIYCENIKPSIT